MVSIIIHIKYFKESTQLKNFADVCNGLFLLLVIKESICWIVFFPEYWVSDFDIILKDYLEI